MLVKRGNYTFVPTNAEGRSANIIAATVTFTCLTISCLVVAAAFCLWYDKRLRHHFNKTSTQLLFTCVAITIPQGLATASTTLDVGKHEKGFCEFGMVGVIFGFNVANWLQCCICVNLILALRRPSVFRYRVKLWYYVSAFSSSAILAILPLIFDQYRWNTQNHSCWLRSSDSVFDVWQLVVLESPILLVTIFMFISTGFVAYHLVIHRKKGKSHSELLNQLYEPAFDVDADGLAITTETNMGKRFEIEEVVLHEKFNPKLQDLPNSPSKRSPSRRSPKSVTWSPRASSFISNVKNHYSRPTAPQLKDIPEVVVPKRVRVARLPVSAHFGADPAQEEKRKVRNTILRISCYPVIHLLISVLSPLGALVLSESEDASRGRQVSLYYMTFIGSAWVPLAYSACALLADTSIYDAWAERRSLSRGEPEESLELALGRNKHRLSQLSFPDGAIYSPGKVPDPSVEKFVTVRRTPVNLHCDMINEEDELGDEEDEAMGCSSSSTHSRDSHLTSLAPWLSQSDSIAEKV